MNQRKLVDLQDRFNHRETIYQTDPLFHQDYRAWRRETIHQTDLVFHQDHRAWGSVRNRRQNECLSLRRKKLQ